MTPAAAPPAPTDRELVRRLLGLAWRYRGHCLRVLGLQLILLTLGLGGLNLTGVGIDYIRHRVDPSAPPAAPGPAWQWRPDADAPPLEVLTRLAGLILLFAAVRAWLNYSYAVSVNRLVQQRLVVDLRGEVFEKLQRLSFRFFDAHTTSSIITRVTSDVQGVRMFVDQVLIQGVIMVISLTVYVAYMASLSPGLTVACLATTPLLAALSIHHTRRTQPEQLRGRLLAERMVQTFVESLQGIVVTKAFGREAEDRTRFESANDAVRDQQHVIFRRVSLFAPALGFLTRVNMMVLLGYGGWLVIRGELALGSGLVVFAGLLEQFSGQVSHVATLVNSVQQSLLGARRVCEILDARPEVASAPGALRRPRFRGEIAFEGVSFAYGTAAPALRGIDLQVPAGACVALLGATGAGKSTLMSLVPRFHDPSGGVVRIDGVDARRFDLEDLRRNIGVVFQESFLFSDTVAANIAFGHPGASRGRIEEAARLASAHDFITRLPKGYDTVLGEGGGGLSGGQRQRLALARAVLPGPSILLLDDPTAAVDSATEHEILAALDRAIEGRTTFLVAHRLSTLRRADFIVVLERGCIVQRGTHAELMRQSGPYQRVATLQLLDGRGLDEPRKEGP